MTWKVVEPFGKSVRWRTPVRVALAQINPDRPAALSVTISKAKMAELGNARRVNAFYGEGDHRGMVMLQFCEDGRFIVGRINSAGGARIWIPAWPGAPTQKVARREAAFEHDGTSGLRISLPKAWLSGDAPATEKPTPRLVNNTSSVMGDPPAGRSALARRAS